jgi:hypothetical protein
MIRGGCIMDVLLLPIAEKPNSTVYTPNGPHRWIPTRVRSILGFKEQNPIRKSRQMFSDGLLPYLQNARLHVAVHISAIVTIKSHPADELGLYWAQPRQHRLNLVSLNNQRSLNLNSAHLPIFLKGHRNVIHLI